MMFKGVFYMKSKRVIAAMLSAVMLAGQCISVFAEDENITKLTFGYPTGWESTEQTGSYTFYQPNCKLLGQKKMFQTGKITKNLFSFTCSFERYYISGK